jgi:hypothetical protein
LSSKVIGQQGLATGAGCSDNDLVTITYSHGSRVRAVLLSRTAGTLRVAVEGDSDVRQFHCAGGTWVSEECEAVTIEFDWERQARPIPTVEECICSPELAERLMAQLLNPTDDQLEDMLYVLSTERMLSGLPQTPTLIN